MVTVVFFTNREQRCYTDCIMQVSIFGASGKVGRQVVARLLAADHQVVALIHRHNPLGEAENLRIVRGSIDNIDAVNQTIDGSQAVISTLGSWGSNNKTVVSSGTAAIISSMKTKGLQRLITLTGASAFYAADQPNWLDRATHALLSIVAPKILKDGEDHLRLLEASGLDWTCIRSPVMTGQASGRYELTDTLPSLLASIPRSTVAQCLTDQLADSSQRAKAPVIRRGGNK